MRRISAKVAALALAMGAMTTAVPAQAADAGQTVNDRIVTTQTTEPGPTVQMLDCGGTTGSFGCGPGWTWRDGWRGFACYPC